MFRVKKRKLEIEKSSIDSAPKDFTVGNISGCFFSDKNVIFRDVKDCQSTESCGHRGHYRGQPVLLPTSLHTKVLPIP